MLCAQLHAGHAVMLSRAGRRLCWRRARRREARLRPNQLRSGCAPRPAWAARPRRQVDAMDRRLCRRCASPRRGGSRRRGRGRVACVSCRVRAARRARSLRCDRLPQHQRRRAGADADPAIAGRGACGAGRPAAPPLRTRAGCRAKVPRGLSMHSAHAQAPRAWAAPGSVPERWRVGRSCKADCLRACIRDRGCWVRGSAAYSLSSPHRAADFVKVWTILMRTPVWKGPRLPGCCAALAVCFD